MNTGGYRTRWLGVIAGALLSLQLAGYAGDGGAPVLAAPQAANGQASSAPSKQMPGFIRDWYGFSKVPYNGQGQTIAIIGTGDYQEAGADLAVFIDTYRTGSMHGLSNADPCTVAAGPHPCFERVKVPAASKKYPDLYWSGGTHYQMEAASDVQWAHVVAPGANILFVDAATPTPDDVMGAVDVAVEKGSSVVSISLGWEQTADDAGREEHFADHPGVVFVAASGDSDHGGNQLYPAASPNVLAVGGTTLSMVGSQWAEGAWGRFTDSANHTAPIGSTGGLSRFDAIPAFQHGFHSGTKRGVPDVAYAASWVGFPTYVLGQYYSLGGTSLGAPQWAALVALANEARSNTGQPALTGVAPFYQAAESGAYRSNYRDIVTGTGACMTPACAAGSGYDFATGLGVPRADRLVPALAGITPVEPSAIAATGPGTDSGTITWTTNTDATSQVCYATVQGGPYAACSTLDQSLATVHNVTITGLTAGQSYFYVVKGQDAAGYPYASSEGTFITAAHTSSCATWDCAVEITRSDTGAYNGVSGTLAKAYTSNFLKFQGSAGSTYRISVAIDGGTSVAIYDSNQKQVTVFGGASGSSATWKDVAVPGSDWYYVVVQSAKSSGPLHFTVSMAAK